MHSKELSLSHMTAKTPLSPIPLGVQGLSALGMPLACYQVSRAGVIV